MTVLHVWDLAHPETRYACRSEPRQPGICVIISSRHLPDVKRLDETTQRICKRCHAVIARRVSRPSRGTRPRKTP